MVVAFFFFFFQPFHRFFSSTSAFERNNMPDIPQRPTKAVEIHLSFCNRFSCGSFARGGCGRCTGGDDRRVSSCRGANRFQVGLLGAAAKSQELQPHAADAGRRRQKTILGDELSVIHFPWFVFFHETKMLKLLFFTVFVRYMFAS